MNDYDVALKRIITRPGSGLLRELTGCSRLRWLNIELPEVSNRQVDLLGESDSGELFHIELQSTNEPDFLERMAKYKFAIKASCGRFPRQIVLYVGDRPPAMETWIEVPDLMFRYHLVNIKDLDGQALLRSRDLSDNVIAILTNLGSQPGTLKQIVWQIANGPEAERATAFAELRILAGLRKLRDEVKKEVQMPITEDIMQNEFVMPFIERGFAKGRAEGLEQGLEKGLERGRLEILLGLIESRFGPVNAKTQGWLETLSADQIKSASLRIFTAKSVDELLDLN